MHQTDFSVSELEMKFHNHFKVQGGLLFHKLTTYGGMIEASLSGFDTRIESYKLAIPKFPQVNYNFIANSSVNAVASRSASTNEYFIGIHIGAFHILNDLFLRMMASTNILPAIGNSQNEKETLKLFNPQITDLDQLYISKYNDPQYIYPLDYQRQYFAANFAKTALNFLFDHEYAHVIFGHVDYIGSRSSVFSMDEQDIGLGEISGLDRQTLEMDADAFAAHNGILHMNWILQAADLLPKEKASFFSGWENAISNWVFAVYSLFRLFGYKEYDKNRLSSYSHPPPGIRQRLIMLTIGQLLNERLKVNLEKCVYEIIYEAVGKVELAFKELSEVPLNQNAIDLAFSEEGNEHIGLISANWANIRPNLEKYAFDYLAPI